MHCSVVQLTFKLQTVAILCERFILMHFLQQETDNQKAGLCLALLEIGAWEQASGIMDRLPAFSLLDEDSIARSLCYVIHSTIDPLYRRYKSKINVI